MEDELIAYGTEVKALGGGKIGGYLVRFSDASQPDLTGDYFDAKTAINMPDDLPLLYNHGMDGTLKKRVIGRVKTKADDVGVWAESQMDLRDEYEKAIYAMAEAGKLGYSSGALSHLVEREPAGKSAYIKTWFIGEASLTPTPAEPRNTVMSLKSLLPSDAALTDRDETNQTKSINGENTMSDEIKTAVAQAVADALAQRENEMKAAELKAAELKAAEEAGYKKAVDELKNVKAPRYHSTKPTDDDNDGVGAFKAWMQTGQTNDGLIRPTGIWEAKAAMAIGAGGTGGYLVPDPLYAQIVAKRDLGSWVRQAPTQKFSTPADHLLVPVEDTSMTAFVSTNEAAAYNENEPTIAQVDMVLTKYTKLIKASEEFVNYEGTNFDSWLVDALGRAEAATENTVASAALVAGATSSGITTASATAVTIPELASVAGALGAGYEVMGQTGWLMKNVSLWYLKGVFGTNYYSFDGLFNKPAFISDDLDAIAASKKPIFYGNWNMFGVIEKPGMLVQRNPYLYMANGQIGIFANIFRGFGVLQSEALVYLNTHA